MSKEHPKDIVAEFNEPVKTVPFVERQTAKLNGALVVRQDTPLAECPTNLDLTTPRGKAIAFNCQSAGDQEISANAPTKILATNYLVYPASRIDDETGEV